MNTNTNTNTNTKHTNNHDNNNDNNDNNDSNMFLAASYEHAADKRTRLASPLINESRICDLYVFILYISISLYLCIHIFMCVYIYIYVYIHIYIYIYICIYVGMLLSAVIASTVNMLTLGIVMWGSRIHDASTFQSRTASRITIQRILSNLPCIDRHTETLAGKARILLQNISGEFSRLPLHRILCHGAHDKARNLADRASENRLSSEFFAAWPKILDGHTSRVPPTSQKTGMAS